MKIFIKEKLKKYDSQNQMNKYRFAAHKILQNISEQILIHNVLKNCRTE